VKPTVLGDVLGKDQNNFNLVRLFAAICVLVGHAFAIHNPNGYFDPIVRFIPGEHSGSIGVYIFFFVSGMLITASFIRSNSVSYFVSMRLGRILPGFYVCILLTALVLGPIVSTLPLKEYLRHPGTLFYITENMQLSDTVYVMPGVFVDNYYKNIVNGSLWSLVVETRCYLAVMLIGLAGALASSRTMNFTCLFIVLIYLFAPDKIIYFSDSALITASFFLLGVFAYANRRLVVIDVRIALALLAGWLALKDTGMGRPLLYLFIAYATLVLAAAKPLRRFNVKDDCSYGVYLYGFVVQQTVAHYFPGLTALPSLILTVPFSIALGFASWRLVEKPSLRAARKLAGSLEDIKVQAHATAKRYVGSRGWTLQKSDYHRPPGAPIPTTTGPLPEITPTTSALQPNGKTNHAQRGAAGHDLSRRENT
jgi:peptidoglycan/LPS O-acetylase OafA/YrhL